MESTPPQFGDRHFVTHFYRRGFYIVTHPRHRCVRCADSVPRDGSKIGCSRQQWHVGKRQQRVWNI